MVADDRDPEVGERRIAVQEYGKSNPELLAGFRARGAEVTAVRVYQWALPEDTGPLRTASEPFTAESRATSTEPRSRRVVGALKIVATFAAISDGIPPP